MKFYFSFWLIALALLGWLAPSSKAAVLVTSVWSDSILRYNDKTGKFIDTFVKNGSGGLNLPVEAVFGLNGSLYVNSFETDSILRYDGKTGAFLDTFIPRNRGGLDGSTSIVFVKDISEPSSVVPVSAFIFISGLFKLHSRKKSV